LLVDLQFPHRVYDVTTANDCVSLKDAPSAPSANLHNDRFGDANAAEIPCDWGTRGSREYADAVDYVANCLHTIKLEQGLFNPVLCSHEDQ
jgi:hypothetical protein